MSIPTNNFIKKIWLNKRERIQTINLPKNMQILSFTLVEDGILDQQPTINVLCHSKQSQVVANTFMLLHTHEEVTENMDWWQFHHTYVLENGLELHLFSKRII